MRLIVPALVSARVPALVCVLLSSSVALAEEPAKKPPMKAPPDDDSLKNPFDKKPSPGAPARPPKGPRDPDSLVAPEPPAPPKPRPPAPKPSSEIILHYKRVAGGWTCKGTAPRGDGSSASVAGRVLVKLDLDNAWIVTTFRETTGPLKWTEYRTYDPTAKQWTKLQMVNTAGYITSTSKGEVSGEILWEGTAKSPHGSAQLRDHEKLEPKQLTLWGEVNVNNAWTKTYQVTCKR